MNTVMIIRVPLNSGNLFNIRCPLSFSGRTLLHGVRWLQVFLWKSFASYTFRLKICSYNPVQTISLNNKFITQWHFSLYGIITSFIDYAVQVLLYDTRAPSSTLGLDTAHADSN